jgi:phage terminase large subunit-like protein
MTEVKRFAEFFAVLGYRLEPFQRRIVAEAFSARRELLVLIPRANGKSTLLAAIALWSLLRGRLGSWPTSGTPCAGEPEISNGARVVVGVDASVVHDTTAVCVVRRDGDAYHATWRVWVPSERREGATGRRRGTRARAGRPLSGLSGGL